MTPNLSPVAVVFVALAKNFVTPVSFLRRIFASAHPSPNFAAEGNDFFACISFPPLGGGGAQTSRSGWTTMCPSLYRDFFPLAFAPVSVFRSSGVVDLNVCGVTRDTLDALSRRRGDDRVSFACCCSFPSSSSIGVSSRCSSFYPPGLKRRGKEKGGGTFISGRCEFDLGQRGMSCQGAMAIDRTEYSEMDAERTVVLLYYKPRGVVTSHSSSDAIPRKPWPSSSHDGNGDSDDYDKGDGNDDAGEKSGSIDGRRRRTVYEDVMSMVGFVPSIDSSASSVEFGRIVQTKRRKQQQQQQQQNTAAAGTATGMAPPPSFQDTTGIRSKLHAIGRLDVDTTGLLLLTNDGKLVHHVTNPTLTPIYSCATSYASPESCSASDRPPTPPVSTPPPPPTTTTTNTTFPRHVFAKTYQAVIMGRHDSTSSSPALMKLTKAGADLGNKGGGLCPPPLSLRVLDHPTPKSTLVEITLGEGRNRQVRRMFHSVGSGVMRLHRSWIGRWDMEEEEGIEMEMEMEMETEWVYGGGADNAMAEGQENKTTKKRMVNGVTATSKGGKSECQESHRRRRKRRGGLDLGNLKEGQWRIVSVDEIWNCLGWECRNLDETKYFLRDERKERQSVTRQQQRQRRRQRRGEGEGEGVVKNTRLENTVAGESNIRNKRRRNQRRRRWGPK